MKCITKSLAALSFTLFTLILLVGCVPLASEQTPNQENVSVKVPVVIESRIGIPFFADGVAYFGTEAGTFYAMEAETGREKWRFQTTAANMNRPTVVDGIVYTGGQDGILHALDAESGELLWHFEAGQVDWPIRDKFINGTPTILDGVAYFSSEDFNLYAVDAQTGEELWRFSTTVQQYIVKHKGNSLYFWAYC
ncbi:PQQ-like beta-propeller repeat protein [Chloroflexi bacterium TSY]|nr:PQQ-like beta-propeller repeat protein [Chloroflexi bacterium TSY]